MNTEPRRVVTTSNAPAKLAVALVAPMHVARASLPTTIHFHMLSRLSYTDFIDNGTMLNLNLSASLNITRLIFKPSLCLPHHTVSTFNDLPIPLEKGLQKDGRKVEIKAVVLDKDDCFAYPDSIEVYDSYKVPIICTPPDTQDCLLNWSIDSLRKVKVGLSWSQVTCGVKYCWSNVMG